jgi:hypothetical protein
MNQEVILGLTREAMSKKGRTEIISNRRDFELSSNPTVSYPLLNWIDPIRKVAQISKLELRQRTVRKLWSRGVAASELIRKETGPLRAPRAVPSWRIASNSS